MGQSGSSRLWGRLATYGAVKLPVGQSSCLPERAGTLRMNARSTVLLDYFSVKGTIAT